MKNKEYFRDLLEARSKRLTKLINMSAPNNLIGREVILILQAAIGFCPEEVAQNNLCPNCNKELVNSICVFCDEEAE